MGALENIKAAIQAIGADIKALTNSKQDKLTFDDAATQGSSNLVTSGTTYDAAVWASQLYITNRFYRPDGSYADSVGVDWPQRGDGKYAPIVKTRSADLFTYDKAPTAGSQNLLTSDGINTALSSFVTKSDVAKAVADAVAGAVGVVNHGNNASTPRPKGYGSVYWIGTATPTNAVDGDIWRNG